MKLQPAELDRIASFFRVFSESTRLSLLQELKSGPKSVGELVAALPSTQANISKQLKTLYDAGLVSRQKQSTRVIYSIIDPFVLELCNIACAKLNQAAPVPRPLNF